MPTSRAQKKEKNSLDRRFVIRCFVIRCFIHPVSCNPSSSLFVLSDDPITLPMILTFSSTVKADTGDWRAN